MKGLGNYRFRPQVERKVGVLLRYRGQKATVQFHGGLTYMVPAAPLRKIGVEENGRFVMLVSRLGKDVVDIRVEKAPEARPPMTKGQVPKILKRAGRRVITRK
jgi:hypothetical protein